MAQITAVLADIHGNSPALKAILEDIDQQGCTQAFFLGDLINGIDPAGCVNLLRDWSASLNGNLVCIKGNAESYLLTPTPEAIPADVQQPGHKAFVELIEWFHTQLSADQLAWIDSFPMYHRYKDAILVHDHPIDRLLPETWHKLEVDPRFQEWLYHAPGIYPELPESEWHRLIHHMNEQGFRQVFCGHTHMPFLREQDGKTVCNVGSAGAPLDGDPRGSWALVETQSNGDMTITIRRVVYDIGRVHHLIDQTPGYPRLHDPNFKHAYKKWFATGIHWRAHL